MRIEHLARSVPGLLKRGVLVVLALLLGVAAGLSALIGAAAITDRPPLFLLVGLVIFCLVYLLGCCSPRGIAPAGANASGRSYSAPAPPSSSASSRRPLCNLLDDPHLPPAPVQGQQVWQLSTGSRSPTCGGRRRQCPPDAGHRLARRPRRPDMKGDAGYFGQLAQDGFDVYVYDQVGRGRSSRLADPRGYTLERDVADLEAIRREIGAERMILIGHSSGGKLAAAYAAANPEHVAKMVLSAPEDPCARRSHHEHGWPVEPSRAARGLRLATPAARLLGYTLLQVNPQAAYAFAGDAEMDARFDLVYNRTRPALHCAGKPPGPPSSPVSASTPTIIASPR